MFKISYIYDLVDNISPQLKKIQSNLQQVNNKVAQTAQSMSTSFNKIGDSLKQTSQSVKNAGSTLAPFSVAMGLIGVKAFRSAAEFEMLRIRMNVLTGSVEMGGKAFEEVTKYAAKTPFQIQDISKSLNMMMSTGGMGFEEAMRTIKILGDIAAISGGEMSGMALALSQTSATSKLLGQDFNQFVNNSVPLMKILKDYTGKTTAQIMQMKEDGALSFDVVAKAMEKATKAGGLFENGAEIMSTTLSGLASSLIDNVNIAFAELGSEMAKVIGASEQITKLSDFATKLTEKFKSLSPEAKKFITYAILIGIVLAPIILTIGSLLAVLGLVVSGFGLLAGGLAFLFTPLGFTLSLFARMAIGLYSLKDELIIVYDFLKDKFAGAFDYVADKIKMVMDLINKFRTDSAVVLNFLGLEQMANFVSPDINQPSQINKSQSLTAGGQLDVNIKGLPKGSNAGFTPRPNNFLPVGVNSVFAGY
jgi:tape measure domain-containing protein